MGGCPGDPQVQPPRGHGADLAALRGPVQPPTGITHLRSQRWAARRRCRPWSFAHAPPEPLELCDARWTRRSP